MTFQKALKNAMESQGHTHERLANLCGLQRVTVTSYISGGHDPSLSNFIKLAQIYPSLRVWVREQIRP